MRLVVIEEPNLLPGAPQPDVFDLWYNPSRPVLRVGRKISNDIVIADSSVSRYHLEMQIREDGVLVKDLGSKNGTFISDQPLPPETQVFVRPGTRLRLGDTILKLEATPAILEPEYSLSTAAIASTNKNGKSSLPFDIDIPGTIAAEKAPQPAPKTNGAVPKEDVPAASDKKPATGGGIISNVNNTASRSYPRMDSSELHPPEVMNKILEDRFKPLPKKRFTRNRILAAVAILILAIVAAVLFLLVLNVSGNNSGKMPLFPGSAFSRPANSDSALGVILAHPSNWERQNVDASRVIFTIPESSTAALTIEKPPSRSIQDAGLSPEAAVKQYVSNVKNTAKEFQQLQAPVQTQLKDGTDAWLAKVIFTDTEDNVAVLGYTMQAISFKCNNSLYFVSAGEEEQRYNGPTQQDLEASFANLSCK